MLDPRLPIRRDATDDLVESLTAGMRCEAATMRCSPAAEGWTLDFLAAAGPVASTAKQLFRDYIVSAPADFTLWDPTNIPSELRNSVQVVDNRLFAEVDVVKRVYMPLDLHRYAHLTLLASTGPRFLGWLGLWREEPFTDSEIRQLGQAAPSIRERLMAIDDLSSADVSWSIVESTLETLDRPAFLVRAPNRVELANGAGRVLLQKAKRATLAWIERAMTDSAPGWSATRFKDLGAPDLALVTERPAGANFERRIDDARRAWGLSPAQCSVLRLVVRGFSNKEIAASFKRVEGTIELHVSAILRRARVDSRARLLAKFWEAPDR